MALDTRNFTPQEKACVNCKNYIRKYGPFAILSNLLGNGSEMHRCTYMRIEHDLDNVTGKITTTVKDLSCRGRRRDRYDCSDEGRFWEPSKKWREQKENLFKVIKATEEDKA